MTTASSDEESSSSISSAPELWDPDEYMQSYDSDDYDDATYFQLQSKRVLPQHQAPKKLFETSADRRSRRSKQIRKVPATAAHSGNNSKLAAQKYNQTLFSILQEELLAEISEINPAVAVLLFVWRRCALLTLHVMLLAALKGCSTFSWRATLTRLLCVQFLVQICESLANCAGHTTGNLSSCQHYWLSSQGCSHRDGE